MNKIITIGREFGSGGRELARKLAEKLGFNYYDREVVSEIAKRTELSEKYVSAVLEHNPHDLYPITVGHSFAYADTHINERKHAVFREQENVIRSMAEKSDCVIVGRCADYILQDFNPLKIFVYADMESKIERCKKRNEGDNLTERQIKRHIKSIDRHRARYYEFYTGKVWGDRLNYDICVNTGNRDMDALVSSIARLIK